MFVARVLKHHTLKRARDDNGVVRPPLEGAAPAAPTVPVLLDFTDAMKAQFPFSAGVPNVVVLDAEGRYRYAAAGAPTPAGQAKLLAVIEALHKEAAK